MPYGSDDWEWEAERRAAEAGRRAAGRDLRVTLRVTVAVLLTVVAGGVAYIVTAGIPPGAPPDRTAAPPATGTPDPERSPAVDLDHPYRGTPVATFPDGAGGIVPPPARAVGDFTAEEVGQYLDKTRQLLVLSRLDPRVLLDGDTAPYLDLLAPSERQRLSGLVSSGDRSALALFSRLAPGTRLLDAPVKVKGTISYRAGEPGELVVRYSYTFVYPLRPARPAGELRSGEELLAVVRDQGGFTYGDERFRAPDRGGFHSGGRTLAYNIDCGQYQRGLLSLPRDAGGVAAVAPEPSDPFDPQAPLPEESTCPE